MNSIFFILISSIFASLSCLAAARFTKLINFISLISSSSSLVASLIFTIHQWNQVVYKFIPWFTIGKNTWKLSFHINQPTLLLINLVCLISFLVFLFSTTYMKKEKNYNRYVALLHLFVFSMLVLITSNNLLLTFFGWEGVGFCSYFLIAFWYEKKQAVEAAQKTFLLNKIGDISFLLGIIGLFAQAHSLDLNILEKIDIPNGLWSSASVLALVIGCFIKSAQFPFHHWLPDAMEGPTPVSALMHSATMVTAGVIVLTKISFMLTPSMLILISSVGAITILAGSISACVEWDIKKILAYSTIAQLGYMMIAVGTKGPATFHLITHGIFKAGLFLGAGYILHIIKSSSQDIRYIEKQKKSFLFFSFLILFASLCGIPLSTGFLSKEMILDHLVQVYERSPYIITGLLPLVALAGCALTAFYSTKYIYCLFLQKDKKQNQEPLKNYLLKIPILLLTIGSLSFIFSINPISTKTWWAITKHNQNSLLLLLSLLLTISGIAWAYLKFRKTIFHKTPILLFLNKHNNLLNFIYRKIILSYPLALSKRIHQFDVHIINQSTTIMGKTIVAIGYIIHWIDRILIDSMVTGTSRLASYFSYKLKEITPVSIQKYIQWIILAFILFSIYLLIR